MRTKFTEDTEPGSRSVRYVVVDDRGTILASEDSPEQAETRARGMDFGEIGRDLFLMTETREIVYRIPEDIPEDDPEVMTDGGVTRDEDTDRFLTWEIGVHPAGQPDEWEHHHPPAETEKEARQKALEQAREDGVTDPHIYMVEGPFNPDSFTPRAESELERGDSDD